MSFLVAALKRAAEEAKLAAPRAVSIRQRLRLETMASQLMATANSLEKECD